MIKSLKSKRRVKELRCTGKKIEIALQPFSLLQKLFPPSVAAYFPFIQIEKR